MSRVTVLACAALLLLATAALAQPMVKAPLLNRVASIRDASSYATLPAAIAGEFAFTTIYNTSGATNYYQLIALAHNMSLRTAANKPTYSWNLPSQPTTLFMATNERVGVICNDTVLFFGANMTAVWWVGSIQNVSLKFDIQNTIGSGGSAGTQYPLPAVGPWGEVIIGTMNQYSNIDSSMVYSINATTAMVINSAHVPYRQSNFRPMWDPTTPDLIYVMVSSYTSGANRILPFTIATMMSAGNATVISSESGSTIQFNVYAGIAAVVSYSNGWYFYNVNNGSLLVSGSTGCYGGINFAPAMVAGRWYLSCASYINVFDNVTLARLTNPALTPTGSGSSTYFTAGDVDGWMKSAVVAVCSGSVVYVINGTIPTLFTLATVPTFGGGGSLTANTAIFAYNSTVLQVSYSGSSSGGIVGVDINSGKVIGQITNINPIGWPIWISSLGLDIVAGGDTSGVNTVLGAYNSWFNFTANTGFYVNSSSSTYSYTHAYVANGTAGYYISYSGLTKFNISTGELIAMWTTSSSSWSTTYGPVIVGGFVCYNDYNSNTYCINGETGATTTFSTCDPSTMMPFVVTGNVLAIRCSNYDLYTWVAGATTANTVSGNSYTAAIGGTTAFVSVSSGGFKGYTVPLTASSTAKFTLPTTTYVYSPPVAVGENFAFLSGQYNGGTSFTYGLSVYSAAGSKIGTITVPGMTSAYGMFAKAGGQYGTKGWVYAYNGTVLAGINLNTMNVVFQVKVDLAYSSYQGTPFFTSQGGLCFYGSSNSRFYMISAFSGAQAWWTPISSSNYGQAPIEANGNIYFNDGYNVIGADIFSGESKASVGYGSSMINGFSVWNMSMSNWTTITATTTNGAIIGTTAYVMPSVGFFAGGGGSGSSGSSGEKSKAWIAAIVVGVIVIVVVVIVVKKKGAGTGQAATGQDYVAMNSQQV